MSKSNKSHPCLSTQMVGLNNRPNPAKTMVEPASLEVSCFEGHYRKFEQQTTIGDYSADTIFNYSRAVAKISRHITPENHSIPIGGFTKYRRRLGAIPMAIGT